MISLLACFLAATEPSIASQVKYIPLGTPMELSLDGATEIVRCYNLNEFKLLLRVDFSLQDVEARLGLYEDIDFKYAMIIEDKDKIIVTLRKEREIYRERSERMETNWHEAEELAISNSEGPLWPYIVAAVGTVVGVVGTALFVSEVVR